MVSAMHANFLVNDRRRVPRMCVGWPSGCARVRRVTAIELRYEVEFVGDWPDAPAPTGEEDV